MTALAAALALALAAPDTPLAAPVTPSAAVAAPRTTAVDIDGLRGFVQPDPAGQLAGVELSLAAGLDRQTGDQAGLASLVAETVLRTPVDGVPLLDAVDARGAALQYAVSLDRVRFYLEGTPDGLRAAAPLVARALTAPAFDAATVGAARDALSELSADAETNPRYVGSEMLRSTFYRGGAALPRLGTPAALARYTPADAKAFYDRWYVRRGAFLAAVGHTGEASDTASRALGAALPAGTAVAAGSLATRPFVAEPRRIVTRRDVGAPYLSLGFAAPPLGDRDFAAVLVLRALLEGVYDRSVATTVPEAFRLVGTSYDYEAARPQFVLWINGALVDPTTGLATIDAVVRGVAAKPLAATVLARYRDTARGAWAVSRTTLADRATAIGDAVERGLDADAVDAVGAQIARVTGADVQRVAKTYFRTFDVALVLPRGGEGG